MLQLRLLSAVLLILSHTSSQAQWTEADVVRAALVQPAVSAAAWTARDAEAVADGTGLLPDPTIAYERQQLFGAAAQSQDQLRVSWRVPLASRRGAERSLAQLDAHLANWLAEEARARTVTEALEIFYEALAAERRAATLQELGQSLDEAARRARAQARVGERSEAEAARMELEARLLAATIRGADAQSVRARARLASVLAMESLPELDGQLQPGRETFSLESLFATARARRLATLEAALDVGAAARRQMRRAAWPDLELEAGWMHQRQEGANGDGFVAVATLAVPLADHAQTTRGRAEASHALTDLVRSIERRVRTELEASALERTLWADEHARFTAAAATADDVLRAALARFAAGEASFVEVVDARRLVVEVAERALATELEWRSADLRLRAAAGEWR